MTSNETLVHHQGDYTLLEDRVLHADGFIHHEFWLCHQGEPRAYLHGTSESNFLFDIWEIETRLGYRGQGYSTTLLDILASLGYTVRTTGHYTPEGFAALRGKFEVIEGQEVDEAKPSFESTGFVLSWRYRLPKYVPNGAAYEPARRAAWSSYYLQQRRQDMMARRLLWVRD